VWADHHTGDGVSDFTRQNPVDRSEKLIDMLAIFEKDGPRKVSGNEKVLRPCSWLELSSSTRSEKGLECGLVCILKILVSNSFCVNSVDIEQRVEIPRLLAIIGFDD